MLETLRRLMLPIRREQRIVRNAFEGGAASAWPDRCRRHRHRLRHAFLLTVGSRLQSLCRSGAPKFFRHFTGRRANRKRKYAAARSASAGRGAAMRARHGDRPRLGRASSRGVNSGRNAFFSAMKVSDPRVKQILSVREIFSPLNGDANRSVASEVQ